MIEHIRLEGDCLPEVYEKAILEVWKKGRSMKTQYDKDGDPESKDAHVTIVVRNPFSRPRYHKNIPGGPGDLQSYIMEVTDGIHDSWIDLNDKNKWQYTYHERLRHYPLVGNNGSITYVDQIEEMCKILSKCNYTRRAQATTWRPGYDNTIDDPPCLQRIWGRIIDGKLQIHTYWRSRDLYKAWFMNAIALTELQKIMVERINELGTPCEIGEYHDTSDSLHIYGSYFGEALPRISKMEDGNWISRSATGDFEEVWIETMEEKRLEIIKEIKTK